MLWAESAGIGIARHLIDVPGCINVGDGGIDAHIQSVDYGKDVKDSFIPTGDTGFQIKAGDLEPLQCKRELHVGGNLNAPIKPEVRRLLDSGGTYIQVLFADLSKKQRTGRENALMDEFRRLGYQNECRT